MTTKEIIEFLKEKETNFVMTNSFSKSPGIYAIFYSENDFPLLGHSVSKHQIIYIGKTESSQEERDAKTHFTSGKTGSSTVRKSLGSILCSQEDLKPIPRNDSDCKAGRFSHFTFDEPSEKFITNWMENNLALSFYEYPANKKLIDKLESKIIEQLKPVLNIDHKNPNNPYKDQIKQLRKNCATIAIKNSNFKNQNIESRDINRSKVQSMTYDSGTVIIDNITKNDIKSRNIRIKVKNKHLFPTEKYGKPISYPLDFNIGNIRFIANYKTGSKDGKSRSGILKLGDSIYQEILKIQVGTILKISKSKENKHIIKRL